MVKKSLSVKASLFVVLVTLLLTSCLATVSYQREKEMFYDRLRTITQTNEVVWQSHTDELKKMKTLVEQEASTFQKNETAIELQPMLEGLLDEGLAANSYLMFPGKKSGTLTVLLANKALYDAGLTPGTEYEMPAQFTRAYEEMEKTGVGITEVITDQYGSLVSVLRPIKDQNGEMIAMFGLDFDYGYIQKSLNEALLETILISLGLQIIFTVLSIILIRRTLRPIKTLSQASMRAAEGDLSIVITAKGSDEIGQLTNHFTVMLANMRALIGQVRDISGQLVESAALLTQNAEQTATASEQIATDISEVAAGSDIQMQGAQETARAMQEMALGIQRIAEYSANVSESASEVSTSASKGNDVILATVEQMNVISGSVRESVRTIEDLLAHSQEISKITDVITDISNQTNLLALNAAIEAARAGEAGRGFAVVADEVRILAEQSKQSSDQIAQLIGGVQNGTKRVMDVMTRAEEEVKTGASVADEAGETFNRIVTSIQTITGQIQEVSASAEEMSASSEEITATIEQVSNTATTANQYTQNVASASEEQLASMQEISSSTNTLNQMAKELQQSISRFKLS